jgi:hypothetical protein
MATSHDDSGHDDPDVASDDVDEPTARSNRPSTARSGDRTTRGGTDQSNPTTKWSIDRLDPRERAFSFAGSAAAALFAIFVEFAHIKPAKGQLHPETVCVIGLIGAALLLGATFLGRRAPVGFVALFIGASFAQAILFLALPFFALAIWLLYRSYKIQRDITAQMRTARRESAAATPARSRSAAVSPSKATPAKAGAAPANARATATKKRNKGPVGPTPNKRYTPKQPAPPAPPPPKLSRRERKAASAQD